MLYARFKGPFLDMILRFYMIWVIISFRDHIIIYTTYTKIKIF